MFIFYFRCWILVNFLVQILCNNSLDSVTQRDAAVVIANGFGSPLVLSRETTAGAVSRFYVHQKGTLGNSKPSFRS